MRPKNSEYLMCIYKSEQLLHQNYKAKKKKKKHKNYQASIS